MALISFVKTWGTIQKTSLLGGVAQILIYPRPSPCLANVGLFVCTNLNRSHPWSETCSPIAQWRINKSLLPAKWRDHRNQNSVHSFQIVVLLVTRELFSFLSWFFLVKGLHVKSSVFVLFFTYTHFTPSLYSRLWYRSTVLSFVAKNHHYNVTTS